MQKDMMRAALFLFMGMIGLPGLAFSGDLQFSFNSPSFNGQGYSAHVLTIEQLQQQAEQRLRDQSAQRLAQEERARLNNPVNQFLGNLQSMIYQQLAKQLNDALFGENPSNSGTLSLAGNTINYNRTGNNINLTIVDTSGNTTQVTVPVGSLAF
jgi:curli production assembly/transport component CsgF